MINLIDRLSTGHFLSYDELHRLIEHRNEEIADYLFERARQVRILHYGHDVYMRGLIEFTNYCRNDCYYCGIRKSNCNADRYRLTKDQILDCCAAGYKLGFRTFVLQGGEDGYYTDENIADMVSSIKSNHPDCAVTLSLGERSYESYKCFMKQEPTGIFFAMKQQTKTIIQNFTLRFYYLKTGNNAL